jgi:hypothetical protein
MNQANLRSASPHSFILESNSTRSLRRSSSKPAAQLNDLSELSDLARKLNSLLISGRVFVFDNRTIDGADHKTGMGGRDADKRRLQECCTNFGVTITKVTG